jgi:NADH:ubiquinone oxidoreductase subunit 6 (subunit J)
MKTLIVLLLLAVVVTLFFSMTYMIKDDSQSRRTVRALTVRIGLSVTIIVVLFISMKMGWIQPHGVRP